MSLCSDAWIRTLVRSSNRDKNEAVEVKSKERVWAACAGSRRREKAGPLFKP